MVPFAVMERTVTYLTLPSRWVYEVGQYKSYGTVGWKKSYKRGKNKRNITTSCSEGNLSSHLCQLLLTLPSGNSCAVCLKERKKGPEKNLTLICTHIMTAGV